MPSQYAPVPVSAKNVCLSRPSSVGKGRDLLFGYPSLPSPLGVFLDRTIKSERTRFPGSRSVQLPMICCHCRLSLSRASVACQSCRTASFAGLIAASWVSVTTVSVSCRALAAYCICSCVAVASCLTIRWRRLRQPSMIHSRHLQELYTITVKTS